MNSLLMTAIISLWQITNILDFVISLVDGADNSL